MENQNNDKQEKKNNNFDYLCIIFAVGCIYLFGPIPGLCGFGVEELLKRTWAKKSGKDLYTVISYVVGAVAALALNVILGKVISSI